MKKYGLFLATALLLAACSEESSNQDQKNVVEAAGKEEVAEQLNNESSAKAEQDQKNQELSNTEQVNHKWYEEWTGEAEVVFEETVDFNLDGQDELVIGTSTHLIVGALNLESNEWETVYSDDAQAVAFTDIMENETVGQMAAVTTVSNDERAEGSDTLRLLRFSERDNGFEVIEAFRSEAIDHAGGVEYNINDNLLSIISEFDPAFNNEYLLVGDELQHRHRNISLYSGVPVTQNEKFMSLFPEYFESGILRGDTLSTAIEKAGEGKRGYVTGSPSVKYDEFTLLFRNDNEIIANILLHNDGLTIEDLEGAINQDITITSVETDMVGYIHYANFTFDDVKYYVEFKDENGEVKFLNVGVNHEITD
ncbi:hypothetical protein [Jeotgalibacillus sp. R-1-5s-1]|uniref:hypothetical protein n=1 Tax=Jeotgalibacillus sp. R-1-5s-1 TaxID=2555897 RepID=UPI00106A3200|nr:hypothetical protein [Jeotgalibacillus sp. R-1-5s-1]TFD97076.1 hypothetical protein E2491_10320 [Jeotgalibacillus sp. R-1-5s-1]